LIYDQDSRVLGVKDSIEILYDHRIIISSPLRGGLRWGLSGYSTPTLIFVDPLLASP
jgi:hypothetical protein